MANTKGTHQYANVSACGEEKHQWEVKSSVGLDRSQGHALTHGENSAIYGEGRQRNSTDGKYQHGAQRSVISGFLFSMEKLNLDGSKLLTPTFMNGSALVLEFLLICKQALLFPMFNAFFVGVFFF